MTPKAPRAQRGELDAATLPGRFHHLRHGGFDARLRNLGLGRPLVRGLNKLKTWMTGFAPALNILTERRLREAALA